MPGRTKRAVYPAACTSLYMWGFLALKTQFFVFVYFKIVNLLSPTCPGRDVPFSYEFPWVLLMGNLEVSFIDVYMSWSFSKGETVAEMYPKGDVLNKSVQMCPYVL